jgi:hypothetical protein
MTEQRTDRKDQDLALDRDSCEFKKREAEGRDRVRAPAPARDSSHMFVAPSADAPLEGLPELPGLGGLPVFEPLLVP